MFDEKTFSDLDLTRLTTDDMNHLKDCFLIQNVGLIPEKGKVGGFNSKHEHYTKAS